MKRIEVMKRIMAGILVTATVLTGTLLRDLVRTQKYLLGEETTIDTDADYLEDGNYEETDLTALQELLVGIFKIPWEE